MSRNFRNYRQPEIWPSGQQEYWIYMPTNLSHFVSTTGRSMNHTRGQARDPWWIFEERSFRQPNYYAAPRQLEPLLLIDEYSSTYPVAPHTEDQESSLSWQEQKQALSKLRKQLYSPTIDSIIKRLGTKAGSSRLSEDDGMKRCAVCLEDFESKQFVTVTPCNHMFHEDCIVPWVKSQGKCPVCRYTI